MKAEKFFEEFYQEFSKILAAPPGKRGVCGQSRASGGDIFSKMKMGLL